jgi:hypothetical protein
VFPTRDNNQYSAWGFKALWQRCVTTAIAQDILTLETRFTVHDFRVHYASKHKLDRGELRDLHASRETTANVSGRNTVVGRQSY